jgi:DNA-binding transcriptional LysR family regulator
VVFEATARHGSFTKAAAELDITQPTVSTQIKQLTKAVGLPLFEQIGKRIYLTEAGRELLATCHEIFDRLDRFEMDVAELRGMKRGKLRLATVTTAQYFIPEILGRFCESYPDVDIALEITNHEQLERRILGNEDDLYVLSDPPTDIPVEVRPFLENPLVVIARRDHPLAGRRDIPIEAIENEPFIMRETGSGTRKAIQQFFLQNEISVPVRLEIGNNEAIKQAIAGGLGISVLSRHVLNLERSDGEFTILDVRGFPIRQKWYAVYPTGKKLSVIARTFLDYLVETSRERENTLFSLPRSIPPRAS